MHLIKPIAASAVLLMVVSGCSNSSIFEPVLETDGKEMIDIYRHALQDGDTVDDKLTRRADAETKGKAAADEFASDENEHTASKEGPTTAQLAEASNNRLYRNKAYTKWEGRFYDKKTGQEITRFQCGLAGRVQRKPCPPNYGHVPDYQEKKAQRNAAKLAALEGEVRKGPATAASIIAKQQRWMEEKRRRDAAIANGFVVEEAMPAEAALSNQSMPDSGTQAQSQSQSKPACAAQDGIYCGYERTARNEIQQLFPRLPNPDILVFVTPHLATRNRVPVPGYTTVLPLYDQVHYAMPGEQSGHEQ